MIEQRTILDQLEIIRSGHIQVRLGLLLVEDGKELASQWHRTTIEPGGDVQAQLAAVNLHLVQMGKMPLALIEIQHIEAVSQLIHTPQVIEQHRQQSARARAALNQAGQ